jgi:PAS domain S-box-containing protein
MHNIKILLAGDEPESLKCLEAILKSEGYRTIASCVNEIQIPLRDDFDLVLIDIKAHDIKGYYLCYQIRSNTQLKDVPIIIYKNATKFDQDLEKIVADLVIQKPAARKTISASIHQVVAQNHLTRGPFDVESFFDLFYKLSNEIIDGLQDHHTTLKAENSRLEFGISDRTKELLNAKGDLNEAKTELNAAIEEHRSANEELGALNDQLTLASETIKEQSETILAQKELALRKSEQNLEIVFANTQEEILVLDSHGKVVFFNNALDKFIHFATGVKPKTGMFVWDVTVPERKQASKELFERALNGEQIELEAPIKTSEGEVIHLLRYSPVVIHDNVSYVTIISTDITARKKQEAQLRKSQANLQAIFHNTVDCLMLLDSNLNIVAFNDTNAKLVNDFTGKKLTVGETVFNTLSEDRREGFQKSIDEVNAGKEIKTISLYGSGKNERWFEISISPVKDNTNNIIGYCITSHDISDVKKAEIEIVRLNKSLIDFQNAIQRSSIVSIADKNGDITFVNDNFVKISGYTKEELYGKNHRLINSGYHPKSFWVNMWRTISNGKVWRSRVKNKKKDGTFYWVDTFIMPFTDEKGKIDQYLSIRNDITLSKKNEEELIQKQILLQEASRISKIGYYVVDKKTGVLTVSPELLWIFDVTEKEFTEDHSVLSKRIHPQDVAKVPLQILEPFDDSSDTEFRIVDNKGTIRWLYRKSNLAMVIDNEEKIIGTIQDITDRKTIEEVLREYNERFEILSKATNDAIWDVDLRLNLIIWNHAISHIFGYDEIDTAFDIGWWKSKLHPDDLHRIVSDFDSAMSARSNSWNSTYRFKCADGSYKHVYNRSYILYDDNGPIRVIGSMQDISERVRAIEEIEKLSLVASRTNNGVMITDKKGRIEWVNDSFSKLTGYSNEEIKGKQSTILQGEETDHQTIRRISEKLRRHEPVSEEILSYTKSRTRFWLRLDIVPIFDESGMLKNFISTQTDITELKEFENSITSIARELANLIENANVPIFGVDLSGSINEWNGVSAELTEFSKAEVMGSNWSQVFIEPGNSKKSEIIFNQTLSNKSVSNFELPVITKSGKRIILLLSASPRRNSNNEITGVIFVGQNITELTDYRNNLERKVEERTKELHAALNKEKELVKMKSQFVSIASHEFRTPLTSIAMAAGYIKKYKEKLTAEAIDGKIANIEKQVHHMTYLLDDILMVGKAEAGKILVNLKPVKISDFIKNLCGEVARTTGDTHVIFLEEKLAYREIISDEKLLRNIIINLLTNAIKFSPQAKKVDVTLMTKDDSLFLTVKDYGMGIPEKDIENLFQPFFRGGNVNSIQGTGLGLSIIKKAIDLLEGKLKLTSEVGRGTEIMIELPI